MKMHSIHYIVLFQSILLIILAVLMIYDKNKTQQCINFKEENLIANIIKYANYVFVGIGVLITFMLVANIGGLRLNHKIWNFIVIFFPWLVIVAAGSSLIYLVIVMNCYETDYIIAIPNQIPQVIKRISFTAENWATAIILILLFGSSIYFIGDQQINHMNLVRSQNVN